MLKDLIGKKFGKLLVIKRYEKPINYKSKKAYWLCRCDCGKTKIVRGSHLISGNVRSCGCINLEREHKKNKIKVCDDFIIIYSSNKNVKYIIDKDDYDKIKNFCWFSNYENYLITSYRSKRITLHRLILNIVDHTEKIGDHINGNIFDNRKCNLRVVTKKENGKNRRKQKNNSSGTTGVKKVTNCNSWQAEITFNGKRIYLGCFKLKEDAIKARKEAEIKYFGEYRRKQSE